MRIAARAPATHRPFSTPDSPQYALRFDSTTSRPPLTVTIEIRSATQKRCRNASSNRIPMMIRALTSHRR